MIDVLETDMLLATDPGGIIIRKNEYAIAEKIRWWAAIKKGELWGNPNKGNRLHYFCHRPPSPLTFSQLEMEIANDLPTQVPLKIMNISCTWAKAGDKYTRLTILYQDLITNDVAVYSGDIINKS